MQISKRDVDSKPRFVFDIVSHSGIVLSAPLHHDKLERVYDESIHFGGMSLSPDAKHLVFAAEKTPPKRKGWYDCCVIGP